MRNKTMKKYIYICDNYNDTIVSNSFILTYDIKP